MDKIKIHVQDLNLYYGENHDRQPYGRHCPVLKHLPDSDSCIRLYHHAERPHVFGQHHIQIKGADKRHGKTYYAHPHE